MFSWSSAFERHPSPEESGVDPTADEADPEVAFAKRSLASIPSLREGSPPMRAETKVLFVTDCRPVVDRRREWPVVSARIRGRRALSR
jgi:hypothetical protein